MLPFFSLNRPLFAFVKDRQRKGIMIKFNPIIVFIGRSLLTDISYYYLVK